MKPIGTITVVTAAIIAVVMLSVFGNERTQVCSCWEAPPAIAFEGATMVFYGEVVEKREVASDWVEWSEHHYVIEFKVRQVWKGLVTETIYINTLPDSAGCGGYPWFEVGEEYFVYVSNYDHEYMPLVELCDRIVNSDRADEDFEALGDGLIPRPGTSAPTPTPAPVWQTVSGNCNASTQAPFEASYLLLVAGIIAIASRK